MMESENKVSYIPKTQLASTLKLEIEDMFEEINKVRSKPDLCSKDLDTLQEMLSWIKKAQITYEQLFLQGEV